MRTVELQLVIDTFHGDMIGVIPSTYDLCRMYDDKSVKFEVTSNGSLALKEYKIYLRFISGHLDIGKALVKPDDDFKYYYELSKMYTTQSTLGVQVILVDINSNEIRTNIVNFNLFNSLPQDKKFYQNLSYLNRLVCDKKIVLEVDNDYNELVIYDDLENELCSFDIEYMLVGGDEDEN